MNLDSLCRKLNVTNTRKDFHGALLDANLLSLENFMLVLKGVIKSCLISVNSKFSFLCIDKLASILPPA